MVVVVSTRSSAVTVPTLESSPAAELRIPTLTPMATAAANTAAEIPAATRKALFDAMICSIQSILCHERRDGPSRRRSGEIKELAKISASPPPRCQRGGVDLLVVEDDPTISEPLVSGLRREGFDVRLAANGAEAMQGPPVDLVLLDLGLPDLDGLEVCRRLRARTDIPIIVVTARSDEVDRVVLLEAGADDYVVKPFGFRELVARIRAVSRRAGSVDESHAVDVIGALVIDGRAHRATLDDRALELTPKEFGLLALLGSDPGALFTRERILDEVWDANWYGPTKTLDVHIAALRKKLGDPTWIETVRGVGFRLDDRR